MATVCLGTVAIHVNIAPVFMCVVSTVCCIVHAYKYYEKLYTHAHTQALLNYDIHRPSSCSVFKQQCKMWQKAFFTK